MTEVTKQTLLIVDDEPGVREGLAFVGEMAEMAVVDAENGVAALDIIAKNSGNIDVILSDLAMPKMNGLELLKNLHQNNIEIPFIFITGLPSEELSLKAFEFGAYDCIEKPFQLASVLKMIESSLEFQSHCTAIKAKLNELELYFTQSQINLLSIMKTVPENITDQNSLTSQLEECLQQSIQKALNSCQNFRQHEDGYYIAGEVLRLVRYCHDYLGDYPRQNNQLICQYLVKLATQVRVHYRSPAKTLKVLIEGLSLWKRTITLPQDSFESDVINFLEKFAA